jgi:hypothetical protein
MEPDATVHKNLAHEKGDLRTIVHFCPGAAMYGGNLWRQWRWLCDQRMGNSCFSIVERDTNPRYSLDLVGDQFPECNLKPQRRASGDHPLVARWKSNIYDNPMLTPI